MMEVEQLTHDLANDKNKCESLGKCFDESIQNGSHCYEPEST